ncbi:MAG TPA: DUF4397 domain-containing protein [Gemmatimonas sp.]|nr:DUF4397 domain-containing protein [Gemmatimonas sp.]
MNSLRTIAALLCTVVLTACEKNAVQDITGSLPGARIKFFNFGVNAPSVNFYANTAKMTAISSATGAESTAGVAYAGVGNNSLYSAIDPGQYTFTARISATVDKDLPISTLSATLADGKDYSFYMSGLYNTTSKNVEGFVIEDPLPATIDWANGAVRFVNAISNSQPMTLYAKNTVTMAEVPIGGATAYKGGTAFVTLPTGVYDLRARVTGAATDAIVRTAVSFVFGRTYTIAARGDITVTSTTAAQRPILDFTTNR